jgi:signal transduction histidine kinase
MLASYGKRLYDSDNRFVGIISTDLSLRRLSEVFSAEKPYPNSYFMMVDDEGRYFIHPDSTMLFTHTVFNGADPRRNPDIIALGHEMTAGKAGSMPVVINGVPSFVCYRPVPGTTWSLAIVCPDSDIMKGYHKLNIIMMPLLVAGLFIILLFSRRAVSHAIRPLDRLLEQTQSIASGNYEVYIPHTRREDAVGRLQNSFAAMLQSLNFHMGSIRYTADVAKSRNEELTRATRMAEEADRQKTTFIQNMSHQIRTPLNIIMGFAQILRDTVSPPGAPAPASSILSDDEKKSITDAMLHNALLLNRMVLTLFDSSDSGLTEELNTSRSDMVSCNAVARESISYAGRYYPELAISFQSSVDDNYCIQTSHIYLMRSLRELLYNAAKYSDRQHVSMRVETTDTTVRFVVEDTGKGIAEADRDQMFKFFTKVDDLSEGLGLGLPLSKRHAQNLGGDLTLDTGYTAGCRFILELPLTSPTQG